MPTDAGGEFSPGEVARLFDVTTQSVDAFKKSGRYGWNADTKTFGREEIESEARRRHRAAVATVGRIEVTAVELAVDLASQGLYESAEAKPIDRGTVDLASALSAERAGRAAAEERIDGLKQALRRANRAMRELLEDPDRLMDDPDPVDIR